MSLHHETSDALHNPNLIVQEMALIQKVKTDDVWQWLAKGWDDLRYSWPVSIFYATFFVAAGFAISFGFYFMGMSYLILPGLSGFLLVGPALGVGFYEISRRREAGDPLRFKDPFLAYRRNTLGIMGLGVFMVFLFQVWIRLSFTIAAISYPGVSPEWSAIIERSLTTFQGLQFGFYISLLGAVFATLIFFVGAFSMPMMVARRSILIPSMITSAFAVAANRNAMLLWAAVIVLVTFAGLVTGLLGLILSFPLIGHATWHSYKAVIRQEP